MKWSFVLLSLIAAAQATPTPAPTMSKQPTPQPTYFPSPQPSSKPTPGPTEQPTFFPSPQPSSQPTPGPTEQPTFFPSPQPSSQPTPGPTEQPTFYPSPQPSEQPTPGPTEQPTFQPTPLPTVSLMPTSSPTNDDTVRLDVVLGIDGDTACTFVSTSEEFIRNVVAKSLVDKQGNTTIKKDDIVAFSYTGCGRRRRKLLATQVVSITISFATSLSGTGFLNADGFYDAATQSLSNAVNAIKTSFEASCGCTINVNTIKVALSTRTEPLDTVFDEPEPEPMNTYYAGADCPNGCSGHGSCSTDGCVCWSHWGNGDETGGACDQRKCPYEIAWVDTPSSENKAHALRECAGRGVCDRETGDCQCFPGYTGKGCRRTTCPNDCSGHGTCEYLAEMHNNLGDDFKWTGNKPTRNQYDFEFPLLWDAHKTRGCVCDPKYTGLDCSVRMCPRGDYANYYKLQKRPETQAVVFTNVFTPGTDLGDYTGSNSSIVGNQANGDFALTFRSTLNEEFTTIALNVYELTEESVEDALNSLPNKVVEEASVVLYRNLSKYNESTYYNHNRIYKNLIPYPYGKANREFVNFTWYDTDLVMLITFNGAMTAGDQYALECKTAYCGAGCQPIIEDAFDFKTGSECKVLNNYEPSIAQNWECSGRGECGESGVCECYEGYTDEYCSTKTAII